MKNAKHLAAVMFLLVLLTVGLIWLFPYCSQTEFQESSSSHVYASWDTMEFDKCVAGWMITRFIDKGATFVFYPRSSDIARGIPFDVPGAEWSRKHRKCTSDCILESIDNPDQAIRKIVSIAAKTELNFWQLDRWPEAQRYFYEIKEIIDQNPEPDECFAAVFPYFDNLYINFKKTIISDKDAHEDQALFTD